MLPPSDDLNRKEGFMVACVASLSCPRNTGLVGYWTRCIAAFWCCSPWFIYLFVWSQAALELFVEHLLFIVGCAATCSMIASYFDGRKEFFQMPRQRISLPRYTIKSISWTQNSHYKLAKRRSDTTIISVVASGGEILLWWLGAATDPNRAVTTEPVVSIDRTECIDVVGQSTMNRTPIGLFAQIDRLV